MNRSREFGLGTALVSALLACGCIAENEPPRYAPPPAQPVAPRIVAMPPAVEAAPPSPSFSAPAPQYDNIAAGTPKAPRLGWPRVFQEGAETLTMYQPQIEQWDSTTITFRAAISVAPAEAGASGQAQGGEPVFGMVRTSARADVDKAARTVTLHDFQIVKVSFPTAPAKDEPYLAILRNRLPAGAKEISLDRLEAGAAVSEAVRKQRALDVKNDPPRIIFTTGPALLVLVDGDSVLRPMSVEGVERVVNTSALIARIGDAYYLTAMGFWYRAPAVLGPWTPLPSPPQVLAQVRDAAIATKQVDLMETDTGAQALDEPPAVYVSAVPAELIQTDGPPQFIPVEGTRLLQAQNSDDAIFVDQQTAEFYVLISGRWFKSPSLDRGPWQFVPGRSLPPDFAKISPDNPRANVLVSVPGTPEAKEALIANSIPQTAVVERGEGAVDLLYDGAADGQPQFEAIEGAAPLYYAVNASLPVVEIAPDSFYCVQNGIWFVAPGPFGPWVAATVVPAAIYAIPVSCPIHYATYCRISGYTDRVIYTGYTPGYLGTVVSSDGVVVFGTGYRYRPRIGRVWNATPCTYGFNAGFACGSDTGFAFGFAVGVFNGGRPDPRWGPYDWGWRHGFEYRRISVNHVDVYEHWHGNVASIPHRAAPGRVEVNTRPAQTPFNPYSARRPAPVRAVSVTPAPHMAPTAQVRAARAEKIDWSENGRPRPRPVIQPPAPPVVAAHTPQPPPVPSRSTERNEVHPAAPPHVAPGPTIPVAPRPPATTIEGKPAPGARPSFTPPKPAIQPNDVYVSRTGDIYRRTPPALPKSPASKPATTVIPPATPATPPPAKPTPPVTEPPERFRPTPTPHVPPATPLPPKPTPPVAEPPERFRPSPTPHTPPPPAVSTPQPQAGQWEQHTQSGWKPVAPQSPTFQKAAPELNREAAARDAGQTRAARSTPDFAPRASTPIVPSRIEPPRAPAPTPSPAPPAPAPRFTPAPPPPSGGSSSGDKTHGDNLPSKPSIPGKR